MTTYMKSVFVTWLGSSYDILSRPYAASNFVLAESGCFVQAVADECPECRTGDLDFQNNFGDRCACPCVGTCHSLQFILPSRNSW